MLELQEKELMFKFLTRNYPVHRIKSNMRFKRSIIMETGDTYILSDKNSSKELYGKLLNVLNTVFSSNDELNKNALKDFLNLK
jgi:hypothetical protein